MGEAKRRELLAAAALASLEDAIAAAKAMASMGGLAGDEGEPDRKRCALALFRASKRIVQDADTRAPLFHGEDRSRARRLAAEAETVARTIAQTFTEWPGAARVAAPELPDKPEDP